MFQRDLCFYESTTQFSGTPDPHLLASTPSDYEEYQQVQAGSRNSTQTGGTNNLATKTHIDVISMDISCLFFRGEGRAGFSPVVYMPTSPDAFFAQKFQDGESGRTLEIVITLRIKNINLIKTHTGSTNRPKREVIITS